MKLLEEFFVIKGICRTAGLCFAFSSSQLSSSSATQPSWLSAWQLCPPWSVDTDEGVNGQVLSEDDGKVSLQYILANGIPQQASAQNSLSNHFGCAPQSDPNSGEHLQPPLLAFNSLYLP